MITESQLARRYHALSVNCKKVYDAVPISEPWSTSYILSEIQRLCSYTSNMRVLTGSLQALKASGLVQEPQKGLFLRTPIKPGKDESEAEPIEPAKQSEPTTKEEAPMPTAQKPTRNPMAILSELATRCKALADEIETAALEIDEYVTAKDVDAGKLKQLQALLKGLA
jgi:hypothetical protein